MAKKVNKTKYTRRRILVASIAVMFIWGGISIVDSISTSLDKNKKSKISAKALEVPKVNEARKIDQNEIVQNENIIYSAKKYAVPANEVSDILNGTIKSEKKQVFLTFDDGPSLNTDKILNILKEENVHATFFVLGESLLDEKNHSILTDTIKSGNAIANHTYTHDYNKLYPNKKVNVNAFIGELEANNKAMKNILGDNFDCRVLRMPAGYMTRKYYNDENLPLLDEAFKNNNLVSVDWNIDSGDAIGKKSSADTLVQTIIKQSADKNTAVVLMHDTKDKKLTVEALPQIIKYFKENGYEFKVISNSKL